MLFFIWASSFCNFYIITLDLNSSLEGEGAYMKDLLRTSRSLLICTRSYSLVCCKDLTYNMRFSFYRREICKSVSNFDTFCLKYFVSASSLAFSAS